MRNKIIFTVMFVAAASILAAGLGAALEAGRAQRKLIKNDFQ